MECYEDPNLDYKFDAYLIESGTVRYKIKMQANAIMKKNNVEFRPKQKAGNFSAGFKKVQETDNMKAMYGDAETWASKKDNTRDDDDDDIIEDDEGMVVM
jgi:hypothetical protein